MKRTIYLLLMLMIFGTANLKAQVTIGADKAPENFSVLELISGAANRGLRLPQLTAQQKTELEEGQDFIAAKTTTARGLQIYNTDTQCVETWNGTVWMQTCDYAPGEVAYRTGINAPVERRKFATKNLDAALNLPDDPLEQGKITNHTDLNDGYIYGSLFQWGRVADGHQVRTTVPYEGVGPLTSNFDPNGQVAYSAANMNEAPPYDPASTLQKYGHFIKSSGNYSTDPANENWRSPHLALWDRSSSDYNPDTDPCKSLGDNFCLPTEDDWAAIIAGDVTVTEDNCPYYGTDGLFYGVNKWKYVDGSTPESATAGYFIYPPKTGTYSAPPADEDYYSTPTLFLPAGGERICNTGVIEEGAGAYWTMSTNTVLNDASVCLYFTNQGIKAKAISFRSAGLSVRCIER